MGPHYLNRFFTPKSVAIVGASERIDSVGHRLLLFRQALANLAQKEKDWNKRYWIMHAATIYA